MGRFEAYLEVHKPAEKPSFAAIGLSRGSADVRVARLAYRDF